MAVVDICVMFKDSLTKKLKNVKRHCLHIMLLICFVGYKVLYCVAYKAFVDLLDCSYGAPDLRR